MTTPLIFAAAALGIAAIACLTFVHAWRGWLDLKRLELVRDRDDQPGMEGEIGLRIELASVRERLKRLEAIASGVEL